MKKVKLIKKLKKRNQNQVQYIEKILTEKEQLKYNNIQLKTEKEELKQRNAIQHIIIKEKDKKIKKLKK